MDMGANMFQVTNMALARTYWYIIAGAMGGLLAVRGINYYQNWSRFATPHFDFRASAFRNLTRG